MVGVCSDWVKEPLVKVLLKKSGCCLRCWLLWKLGCSSRCHLTLSFRCSYIIRLIWYLWYGKDAFACRTPFLKQCRQRTSLMNDELLIQLDSVQLNRIRYLTGANQLCTSSVSCSWCHESLDLDVDLEASCSDLHCSAARVFMSFPSRVKTYRIGFN